MRFLVAVLVACTLVVPGAAGAAGPIGYVTVVGTNAVVAIDLQTNSVVGEPIPVDRDPKFIAASKDGSKLYVSHRTQKSPVKFKISVVDVASRTEKTIVEDLDQVVDLKLSPDGAKLYVMTVQLEGDVNSADAIVIDTAGTKKPSRIHLGKSSRAQIAFGPQGSDRAYVVGMTSLAAYGVVDMSTDKLVDTIELSGELGLTAIACSSDGKHLFTGSASADETPSLRVLEPGTAKVLRSHQWDTGYPFVMIPGMNGSHLYTVFIDQIDDASAMIIRVTDAGTDAAVAQLKFMQSAEVNPTPSPDGKFLYVPVEADGGQVEVRDTTTYAVVKTIPVKGKPRMMAIAGT